MSLGEWERRALGAIEAGLARSDPGLAALLRIFSRLVSAEAMPVRGKLRALRRGAARRGSAARRRAQLPAAALMRSASPIPRRGWLLAVPLLWLVISAGLIAVALALSTGDHGGADCTPSMGVVCGQQAAGAGLGDGLAL
jgi:hypothetical protein